MRAYFQLLALGTLLACASEAGPGDSGGPADGAHHGMPDAEAVPDGGDAGRADLGSCPADAGFAGDAYAPACPGLSPAEANGAACCDPRGYCASVLSYPCAGFEYFPRFTCGCSLGRYDCHANDPSYCTDPDGG